jgi:hypothetical protein
MHHHGRHHGHGHHRPGSSFEQGHHDFARHCHSERAHSVGSADKAFPARTLFDTGYPFAAQLRPLTPELSYPGQVTPSPTAEGCPKRGGSGECLGDCRVCPNRRGAS